MTDDPDPSNHVLRFPLSRTTPPGPAQPSCELGYGAMAELIGIPREQTTGHWFSRCNGIWYG